jgi:plasmid maintenance system antidote protein VapI
MNLYLYDIGERARRAGRFIGHVRAELQKAWLLEKASRNITQQQIATVLDVDRSVINRQLMGYENLTLRSVAGLAWALGWEPVFYLQKCQADRAIQPMSIASQNEPQSPPPPKVDQIPGGMDLIDPAKFSAAA